MTDMAEPKTLILMFPDWLKVRCSMANVTQKKIADSLGVTRQTVSNWEIGTTLPTLNPEQTKKLCSILNVSFDELAEAFSEGMKVS